MTAMRLYRLLPVKMNSRLTLINEVSSSSKRYNINWSTMIEVFWQSTAQIADKGQLLWFINASQQKYTEISNHTVTSVTREKHLT